MIPGYISCYLVVNDDDGLILYMSGGGAVAV